VKQSKSLFDGGLRIRSGIFYFLLILIVLEVIRYRVQIRTSTLKQEVIQMDLTLQQWIDSCKLVVKAKPKTWTYNPNYLSESAAYRLGFTEVEFKRLKKFTDSGGVVYNFETLKSLLRLSDSVAVHLSDKFRFPSPRRSKSIVKKVALESIVELNEATAIQLQKIHGVGPVLSTRIVKFRDALGGFQDGKQLLDVYGLAPDIAREVTKVFPLLKVPAIKTLNLNSATESELLEFVYFNAAIVENIVAYRFSNGGIYSLQELGEVLGWDKDKIDRIAVYLAL
jgi:DNA uptake protein ComE-like DNA-binding protein